MNLLSGAATRHNSATSSSGAILSLLPATNNALTGVFFKISSGFNSAASMPKRSGSFFKPAFNQASGTQAAYSLLMLSVARARLGYGEMATTGPTLGSTVFHRSTSAAPYESPIAAT